MSKTPSARVIPGRPLAAGLLAWAALAPACGGSVACAADAPATTQRKALVQPAAEQLFDPNVHMRSRDVRVGMKGYGLSVFKGAHIERFEVEVLAILSNGEQIDTDVVLVEASGANLEHTGPIAGMSGSPIYLRCDDGKDRMIGAFAFGWPGSKDPIGGVQPIEQMLALDARPAPDGPGQQAAAPSPTARYDLLAAGAIPKLRTTQARSLSELLNLPRAHHAPTAGRLLPLSVPLGFAGFQPRAAAALSDALHPAGFGPMVPLDAPAPAHSSRPSDNDKLEPGSARIVPILTGDMNMIATGTCTAVIGDRVFGFGHPMFNGGRSGLPMAAGEVDVVIPTTEISFKLGRPGKTIGTFATDATAGVAGLIGPTPGTIPVTMTIKRSEGDRTYRFEAARHEQATIGALAGAAMSATEFRGMAEARGATRWDVRLRYAGGREVRLADIMANGGASDDPFGSPFGSPFGNGGFVAALATALQAIQANPFADVPLEAVEATIELLDAGRVEVATLVEVSLPRTRFKPGETVTADLHLQLDRGARVVRRVTLGLPKDLEPGDYPLTLIESAGAISAEAAARPFEYEVKSLDALFAVLNATQAFPSDAVYLRLDRPEQAKVAVGRQALPNLPQSRALLLAESGRSDVTMFTPAVTARVDLPYVLTAGEAEATITIIRD